MSEPQTSFRRKAFRDESFLRQQISAPATVYRCASGDVIRRFSGVNVGVFKGSLDEPDGLKDLGSHGDVRAAFGE